MTHSSTRATTSRYGAAIDDSLAVFTVAERCKKCYSCVRTCSTKAIQVRGGQAEIIPSLCTSCGYCVSMCSQGAKRIRSSVADVISLLDSDRQTSVMLAPSFPAAFPDVEPQCIVGSFASCGFDRVFEVAFGADLVSYEYNRRYRDLETMDGEFLISSPCPVVVSYVEKICPELTPYLAPVMSPMEAMATVVRNRLTPATSLESAIVFVGPCVAKKDEARRNGLVDHVLTYDEAHELFAARNVDPGEAPAREFDPPRANLGRIYPLAGGLMKAAGVENDLLESPVSIEEGSERVTDLLQDLASSVRAGKPVPTRLFDLLFCEGCIGGPAISNDLTFYERKKNVVSYTKRTPVVDVVAEWAAEHAEYLDLDLTKTFTACTRTERQVPEHDIRAILARTGKLKPEDELNCRACGYESCRDKAIAVYRGIAEVEMCLPYLISRLEEAIEDLKESQGRLIQAEKLASMGQMAAGIAHELNNPLGIVLMYSHLLMSQTAEQPENGSFEDVRRIVREAERARVIVQGILDFARENRLDLQDTDVNALIREAVRVVASLDPAGRIHVELKLQEPIALQRLDSSQVRQVIDNLLKNAVEAMSEGGTITVETSVQDGRLRIVIVDTGPGIPEKMLPHLFTPFHTSKGVGKGTGLGLAVCYGIIKMHGGSIRASNPASGGACFEINFPDHGRMGEDPPM
ncbi:MAG: histidine kinase [Spirochaetaceae bacterium]|nr:MAG: histidine kinase [Spirochaetaceae bacterium]